MTVAGEVGRPGTRARGLTLLEVTLVWLVLINAWGPLALTRDVNRPDPPVSSRLVLGYGLLAAAAVVTIALGAQLAWRRMWWLSLVLAPIGTAICSGWLFLSALFFGSGRLSVVSVALAAPLLGVVLLTLFALGRPLGRLLRNRATQ